MYICSGERERDRQKERDREKVWSLPYLCFILYYYKERKLKDRRHILFFLRFFLVTHARFVIYIIDDI